MRAATEPAAVLGAVIANTGIDVDADAASAELDGWMRYGWGAYRADPGHRHSLLTGSGAPFELSVKVDAGGGLSVRYVVDVADPGVDLAGNMQRYLDAAAHLTGQPEDLLRRLFASHLHDAPPGTPANVMLGVGLASANRRRATVYLPAGWVCEDDIDDRLPGPTGLHQAAQVVGYDFQDGALACWKTYHWFSVDPETPLADRPAGHLLPALAVEVHDEFRTRDSPSLRERATFLQRRFEPDSFEDRLFLFTRPWGLDEGAPMRRLLGLLAGAGLDLAPLRAVAAAARDHSLPLRVGLVAVGGFGAPSATVYFWPERDGGG